MFISFEVETATFQKTHRFLLREADLVKVVQFPQISEHRFSPDFLIGTYLYGNQSIFVVNIESYLQEVPFEDKSLTDIYIFKVGEHFIGLNDLQNMTNHNEGTLVENEEYHDMKHLLKLQSELLSKEFYSKNNTKDRFLLLDLSVIYSQVSDSLMKKYANEILETKEQIKNITVDTLPDITPFKGKVKDSRKRNEEKTDPLVVIIQINKFKIGILDTYITQITSFKEKLQPYDFISDYVLGIKKSRNGNILVFDLMRYFNVDTPNDDQEHVEILINPNIDTPIALIGEKVVRYMEINSEDIVKNIFPITNTEESIFEGIIKENGELIPLVSVEYLIKDLMNPQNLLGVNRKYTLPEKMNNEIVDLDIYSEFLWFGNDFRFGVKLESVDYVQELNQEDDSRFSNSLYHDIPLVNLSKLLEIEYEGKTSLVLIKLNDLQLFALAVPDEDMKFVASSTFGTAEHKVIENLFRNQSQFIEDYKIINGKISFILNLGRVADTISFNEYESRIITGNERKIKGEYLVYSMISKYLLIEIDDVDEITKINGEKDEIYEIEFDEVEDSISLKQYMGSNSIAVKLKSTSNLYSTDSDIEIRTVFEDEFLNSSKYIELKSKDLLEKLNST